VHFRRVHSGFWIATSPDTGDTYVVRTRPRNDGWMAIHDDSAIVISTGNTLSGAIKHCREYDKHVASGTSLLLI
jgi:hypothetical protein